MKNILFDICLEERAGLDKITRGDMDLNPK